MTREELEFDLTPSPELMTSRGIGSTNLGLGFPRSRHGRTGHPHRFDGDLHRRYASRHKGTRPVPHRSDYLGKSVLSFKTNLLSLDTESLKKKKNAFVEIEFISEVD